jgi:hypothetical protein
MASRIIESWSRWQRLLREMEAQQRALGVVA